LKISGVNNINKWLTIVSWSIVTNVSSWFYLDNQQSKCNLAIFPKLVFPKTLISWSTSSLFFYRLKCYWADVYSILINHNKNVSSSNLTSNKSKCWFAISSFPNPAFPKQQQQQCWSVDQLQSLPVKIQITWTINWKTQPNCVKSFLLQSLYAIFKVWLNWNQVLHTIWYLTTSAKDTEM